MSEKIAYQLKFHPELDVNGGVQIPLSDTTFLFDQDAVYYIYQDQQRKLESGILFSANDQHLSAEILVENLVVDEAPMPESHLDIWGESTHWSQIENNHVADPFSGLPSQELSSNSDALSFLYPQQGDSAKSHGGNILHDLGINQSASTIMQRNYTNQKTTYLEQAPLDMLDEYLDEEKIMSYDTNQSPQYITHQVPPVPVYPSSTQSSGIKKIFSSIIHLFF